MMILASHFPCNIPVCHKCAKGADGKVNPVCPHDPQGLSLVHHAETDDCPLNKFPEPTADCVTVEDRAFVESHFRKLWRRIHRRPVEYSDPACELIELRKIIAELPCGQCRNGAIAYLNDFPPDFTSPRNYHFWLVGWHDAVSQKQTPPKPKMTPAHAARVHGLTALMTAEELAADTEPVRLLIRIDWSLGDEVVATAAIRDLLASYPGEYQVSLDCKFPDVFTGLDVSTTPDPAPELIHVFKIHRQLAANRHFIDGAHGDLEATINRPIHRGPLKPQLLLNDEELAAAPLVEGPYWAMAAGYKVDCTTKAAPQETWQGVVDLYRGKIKFVQVGGVGAEHVEQHLDGTIDLTGKTTIRQLFALIASPMCLGVVSGITGVMHIGRAFDKPLVVVAGARETDDVAFYPNSEWIRTSPPCQNCWSLRAQPWEKMGIDGEDPYPGHAKHMCVKPDGQFASCMTAIPPARIAQGIDRFARRGVLGVCSYHDAGFAPWGARASATIQSYAARHNYTFIRPDKPYLTEGHAGWQKAEIVMRELAHFDWLAWLDGDTVIIHPEFDLLAFVKGHPDADLIINRDSNGLCNGVHVWRNTLAAHRFIRRWRDSARKGLCDQISMVKLLNEGGHDLVVREVEQRKINSFIWNESDFLVHFGGGKKKHCHINAYLDEYADPSPPRLPTGGKRAILVIGAESTGLRLWMQHLLACGCEGDASHSQPFDKSLNGAGDLIAWRASFPMGQQMPDVGKMLERLRAAGFADVVCYWCQRDRACSIKSMLAAGHAKTQQEANRDIEEGLRRIGQAVRDHNLPCRIVRYERLIADSAYRDSILAAFGLAPTMELPQVRDENAKYAAALPPSSPAP